MPATQHCIILIAIYRLVTKILKDFLSAVYLLTLILKYTRNHIQSRCCAFKQTLEMNLKFAQYLIILLFLSSCENQETQIKSYGFPKSGNLNVPLTLSEFNSYGKLIDRIREITCNDSIPKIVIKEKKMTRYIYLIEHCEPKIFDPNGKHYVTFRKGNPYEWQSIIEILPSSINKKLTEDFSYYRNSEKPASYLVIIESERNEKVDGIEKFIKSITQEYDELETDLKLNFAFWEVAPNFPPRPENENEIKLEKTIN